MVKLTPAVLALALVGLPACTPKMEPINPSPVVLRSYEVGVRRTARVGEPIFHLEQGAKVPTFIAIRDYRSRSQPAFRITAGDVFAAAGRSPKGELFLANPKIPSYLVVRPDGTPTAWVGVMSNASVPFERLDAPLLRADTATGPTLGAFSAEIIYSGSANGVVRALYREYVDRNVRPAFTQDLQYDLSSTSNEIGFRSIRIRVYSATNTAIEYEVLDDGGLRWLPAVDLRRVVP